MKVNIFINDKYDIIDENEYNLITLRALEILKINKNYNVDLILVSNAKIRKINKKYRNIDDVTDVLSFPFKLGKNLSKEIFILPKGYNNKLGQVIISYDKALEQANQKKHSLEREILILFIHGLVHLLGFNHKNNVQELKMKNMEKQILNG